MTPATTLNFDGGILARGWLSAFLAASQDPEQPVLDRTMHLEVYSDGIRLSATDRYMLLSAWIPSLDGFAERALDEAPDHTLVIRDEDARAKGLMSYLRKLSAKAAKDELPPPEVRIRLGVEAEEGAEPGFPGMELEQVAVELPGAEALRLPVVDGTYPAWRTILLAHKPGKVGAVGLNPEILGRFASLGKIHGGFLRCTFSSPKTMALLEPAGGLTENPPIIRGGFMPVRLDEGRPA